MLSLECRWLLPWFHNHVKMAGHGFINMLNSHISSHRETSKNWWFLKSHASRSSRWCFPLWELLDIDISPEFINNDGRIPAISSPQKKTRAGIYAFVFVTAFSGMCWLYNHHLRGGYHIIKKTSNRTIENYIPAFWIFDTYKTCVLKGLIQHWYCPQNMSHIPI